MNSFHLHICEKNIIYSRYFALPITSIDDDRLKIHFWIESQPGYGCNITFTTNMTLLANRSYNLRSKPPIKHLNILFSPYSQWFIQVYSRCSIIYFHYEYCCHIGIIKSVLLNLLTLRGSLCEYEVPSRLCIFIPGLDTSFSSFLPRPLPTLTLLHSSGSSFYILLFI